MPLLVKDGIMRAHDSFQFCANNSFSLMQLSVHFSTAIVKLLTNKGDGVRSFAQGHSNAGGLWRKNGNWIAAEAHSSAKKFLITAGLAGRNGEDCELIYPTCNALSDTDDYSTNGVNKSSSSRLPFLVSPEHALAIILGRRG